LNHPLDGIGDPVARPRVRGDDADTRAKSGKHTPGIREGVTTPLGGNASDARGQAQICIGSSTP
jgi:hypothetical protein